MSDLTIKATEEMVGSGHATKADTLNRLSLVEHNTDGTHEKLTVGSDADGDMYFRASGVLARLAKGAANLKMFMNAGATAPEWALGVYGGSFTRTLNAAGADVAYTGVGFKPSALFFVGTVGGLEVTYCIGITLGGGVGASIVHYDTHMVCNSEAWCFYNSTGTQYQAAQLLSFDADGFTLRWTSTSDLAGTGTCRFVAFR